MIGYYIIIASISYLIGAIPFAHIIVKAVTGKDITRHGTGNIGAMNVKRTTGSWGWFTIAMLADGCKGLYSVLIAQALTILFRLDSTFASYLAIIFAVIGHNYSIYFLPTRRKIIGGKGLATAGGGILAYNWTFLAVALAIALAVIFSTKYLLAGQITVLLVMPVYVWFISPKDFIYVTVICIIIFLKHAPRIPGLFTGKEPKWNVKDYHQV